MGNAMCFHAGDLDSRSAIGHLCRRIVFFGHSVIQKHHATGRRSQRTQHAAPCYALRLVVVLHRVVSSVSSSGFNSQGKHCPPMEVLAGNHYLVGSHTVVSRLVYQVRWRGWFGGRE